MAEDLVQLGQDVGAALAQDSHVVTADELGDVVTTQKLAAHAVNKLSNTDNDNDKSSSDADDGILITEEEDDDNDDDYDDDEGNNVQEETDLWSIPRFLATCGINLFLPFVNGMMLGFGEILAHELGFKYGWAGARVSPIYLIAISTYKKY